MSCDEVQALLPLVSDGSLDQSGDPALFEHLAHCHECQDALVRHDLIGVALEHGRPAHARSGRRLVFRLPLPLAAAATILVGLGVWFVVQSALATHATSAPLVDVTRVPGADGRAHYEIRQGQGIQVVDPELIDRPGVVTGPGDAQQVQLKRRQRP
jgi:hypothetical protein